MFSRYKKSAINTATPAASADTAQAAAKPAPEASPEAPAPAPAQEKPRAAPPPRKAAQPVPEDKERKRKAKISEIKVQIHKRLLETLNLAALEHASENELRSEISAITNTGMMIQMVAVITPT